MEKQQENKQATDMTWAGPAPAQPDGAQLDGAPPSHRMEVAAEPAPDFRHLPTGGLPHATTYPYPEPERVLLIATFADAEAADGCAHELQRRGLDVVVRMLNPGAARTAQEAGAQADEQAPPRKLGGRVTLGATLGATAGLLASTFVIPEAGTGVPAMLTTLVGAGLGASWGRQAQTTGGAEQKAEAGADQAAALRRHGALLVARADEDQTDAVRERILGWNPVEVRVQ